jgi:hypothetical protein
MRAHRAPCPLHYGRAAAAVKLGVLQLQLQCSCNAATMQRPAAHGRLRSASQPALRGRVKIPRLLCREPRFMNASSSATQAFHVLLNHKLAGLGKFTTGDENARARQCALPRRLATCRASSTPRPRVTVKSTSKRYRALRVVRFRMDDPQPQQGHARKQYLVIRVAAGLARSRAKAIRPGGAHCSERYGPAYVPPFPDL